MLSRIHNAVVRIAIIVVMAFGFVVSPVTISLSHNPIALAAAEAARHAELATQIADHGHSHEDGDAGEQSPGHAHGHNSADHSHDTPNMAAGITPVMQKAARSWQVMLLAFSDPNIRVRLERPPKPIFSV